MRRHTLSCVLGGGGFMLALLSLSAGCLPLLVAGLLALPTALVVAQAESTLFS
jgi:hypothetical protein